ncbi:methyltransferase, putative [Bodo saltans]|uniref:Methyltransferase, putative n=1 Tax=Bodo saltans TaxID=75058 RepID=A0A0S4KJ12_BODSA|nr:methyltransferase, putative [Bodo saltans]|eukprot:CUI14523.1 methyltransferase, putative [Bodo saltans]
MRRQLERKKREREDLDPVLQRCIELIQGDATSGQSQLTDQDRLRTFLKPLISASGCIEGADLVTLCTSLECSSDDLVRIARSVPRSVSSFDKIFPDEFSFAVLKALTPVDVNERRRLASAGEVTEDSSDLITYYKTLFQWGDGEWSAFLKSLSTPLPMTFRVHCSEPALRSFSSYHLGTRPLSSSVAENPITANRGGEFPHVALYGCSHEAYHADADCTLWSRTLHASSCVSFQEVVSALPVAVLNPSPNGSVLDMCAAPGSKSLQALDSVLRHGVDCPDSVVWLNEKDRTKATQTLPARVKRYHAPNVVISRCDATQIPRMYQLPPRGQSEDAPLVEKRFDFIICDVPCSGDGTVRKERSVLASWSPKYVASLVPTQKSLLRRAIDLLAIGGIVVYSTCSMNPEEDEVVVAAALETFQEAVELVDVNEVLKSAGLVMHSSGGVMVPSPMEGTPYSSQRPFQPSKVLRVFPHKDDTGGFFVAAIRKVGMPRMTPPVVVPSKLNQWMGHKRWMRVQHETDEHWRSIMTFFGVSPSAEAEFLKNYRPVFNVNPNGGPQRRIMIVTPAVEKIIFETKPFKGPGLELITIGTRAFEAYDGKYMSGAPCNWRCVMEGASRFARYATKRKVVLNASDSVHSSILEQLVEHGFVFQEKLGEALRALFPEGEDWWTSTGDVHHLIGGSLLVGVVGGPANLQGDNTWWLSGTINRSKIELAVDESLRVFALLTFFGRKPGVTPAEEEEGDSAEVPN